MKKYIFGIFLLFQKRKNVPGMQRQIVIQALREIEAIFNHHNRVKAVAYLTNLTRGQVDFILYLEVDIFSFYESLMNHLQRTALIYYFSPLIIWVSLQNSPLQEKEFLDGIPDFDANNNETLKKYGFIIPFKLTNHWFNLNEEKRKEIIKKLVAEIAVFNRTIESFRYQLLGEMDLLAFLRSNSIVKVQELMGKVKNSQFGTFIESYDIFWGIEKSIYEVLADLLLY